MSNECSTVVWKRDFGSLTRKVIAARLADHADDEGRGIWPSVERVAAQCNASIRTVQRTLADFVTEGVLKIISEGGKGPGSTTRYDFDMRVLEALPLACWGKNKGVTVSPLAVGKGDTDDAKGDTDDKKGCQPDTQTSIKPPIEPSLEREGASEREDSQTASDEGGESRIAIERAFMRFLPRWPTYATDSQPEARRAWQRLTADERLEALAMIDAYLAAEKAAGRKHHCSVGRYLGEKRWTNLPRPQAEPDRPKPAAPFGKAWGAKLFSHLVRLPAALGPLPPASLRVIELNPEKERMMLDDHLRQKGWPDVNEMLRKLGEIPPKPVFVSQAMIEAGADFQPVHSGGELDAAWGRLFGRMKLPALPANRPDWVYYPPIEVGATDLDAAVARAFWAFKERIEGHVHAAAE